MCGIFGLLLNRPLTAADIALGRAGTAALAHRGPDGDGEWMDADKGVYFGHRRLSIIDLGDGGSQPMRRDNSVLTYNGELYNYRALRTALAQEGVGCSSQSDTEVMLRALAHWGEGAFDRFDGMFALALWDGRRATLAVDPFGEKPLYYAVTPDGVYFSSEIGPLAKLLGLHPHFDDEAWAAYLSLGYIPAPKTAYPDIRRLEPASVMKVEAGAVRPTTRYWSPPWRNLGALPPKGPVRPIPESGVDALRDALLESLEGRLIADVPIALFLSAGIDSALVAALCRQGLGRTLNCLTVAFPVGDIVDECAAAAAIAAHLGLPHEVLDNRVDRQAAGIERVVELMGQPSGNTGVLPVDQLCAAAAQTYKVGLTGLGGDEVTWGYGKNQTYWRWRHVFDLPDGARGLLGGLARAVGGRAARFGARMAPPSRELYLANKNFPALGWLKTLPGFDAWAATFGDGATPLEYAVPLFDLQQVMPNMQLPAFDHASMRHGLELRTPFLNRKVIETVAAFDPRALLAFGQKNLLRRLLGRYLPAELYDRPKTGFSFPEEFIVDAAPRPEIPSGLPEPVVEALWRRRADPGAWRSIAVRLMAATITRE